MTDPQDETRPLPRPVVVRRRNWLPSLIWLIPIVAALVGIALVARILTERGPEVVLTFKTAEGLEANKTAVRYKDVQIGTVQNIRLASDRSNVRVTVQLNKEAKSFTAKDTRFWVVRPRLDTPPRRRRANSPAWRRRPSSRATRRASSSCCARATSARSTSARRCTSGASRSASSRPTSSTATAAASRCACSSTHRTTSSSASTRASGMPAGSTCS
jgi:hypothetical protein